MRAIILAAGQGTRLRPLTDDRPKCLVELFGVPLLDRQVAVLNDAGITDITVVTGYRADQIEKKGYHTIHNPDYATTNMVHSLLCAKELLEGDEDVIVSYGDIVYEPRVLDALLACDAPIALVVDKEWRRYWEMRMNNPLEDAETLKLDAHGNVTELGKKPKSYDEIQGQYTGLMKFRADVAGELERVHAAMDPGATYDGQSFGNMYMTTFLQHLIDGGWRVAAVPVENGWLEVDTTHDLKNYEASAKTGTLPRYCDVDAASRKP